ncbi:carbon-nitrogen hydrolase family protein [Deinococcus sp. HMF7604]|uniref:carbon-nitrogen hydrolase family protein n=1 Tax=Deinococcus betulae TaxID=2873312 RepID=UPI001CCB72DA|nr:carbon-nitrogen hydrolase family protein [Deinococcus betulae]MBZ9752274.1 carbon-nitrogen hydrolase family protein [Deinococcus betulae]
MRIPHATLTVATAQYTPTPGDLVHNVERTVVLTHAAARRGARILLLPELSLIGYDLPLLSRPELWVSAADARLFPLRDAAVADGLTIIVGAALHDEVGRPRLAMLAFTPSGDIVTAAKTHLHGQEQRLFEAGTCAPTVLTVDGWRIALAICFDVAFPAHALSAVQESMDVYAVSAVYVQGEERRLDLHLASRAMDHRVFTLLANHGGSGLGWTSCGQSGTWSPTGERRMIASSEDALVVDTLVYGDLMRFRSTG